LFCVEKYKVKATVLGCIAATVLLLFACSREAVNEQEMPAQWLAPEGFPPRVYGTGATRLEEPKLILGYTLFNDPILSKSGTISCASCHQQSAAFADAGKAFSTGEGGQLGSRNAPALFNLAWHTNFMADGGINHLEVMPLAPITDSVEMGESLAGVLAKLEASPDYQKAFQKAFENGEVSIKNMLVALAQFLSSLVSSSSHYDAVQAGKASFSSVEAKGNVLFEQHCANCHKPPLFTDLSYRSNGLDSLSADAGRGRITRLPEDHGTFKVPSLRNIELTGPYMHDGRFQTLEEVLEHYSSGIQQAPNVDTSLYHMPAFTQTERTQLLAFLRSLTDYVFISNSAYGPVE
jgi:cytochrome c peroxidase